MRTRDLKPGFFKNEDLAKLDPRARLLFAGLWGYADRRGRLEDRPLKIKAELFPYENPPIEKLLCALEDANFIRRYEAGGQKLIWIRRFESHQNVHPHEKESVYPPHPDDAAFCRDMPLHESAAPLNYPSFSGPSSTSFPSVPSSSPEPGILTRFKGVK